ncbi:hypothetical protein Droror1_Dr00005509 [Drosera rotundifolia]
MLSMSIQGDGTTAVRKPCQCNAFMVYLGLSIPIFMLAFIVAFGISAAAATSCIDNHKSVFTKANNAIIHMRKLLQSTDDGDTNRVGSTCSRDSISIFQGPTEPLPNGIPTYTVQIQNVCITGCSICNIHLSCGWFSTARLIDPNVFRRVDYDDCVVNNGDPLGPGESVSFQYANSFSYPLSVLSLVCC